MTFFRPPLTILLLSFQHRWALSWRSWKTSRWSRNLIKRLNLNGLRHVMFRLDWSISIYFFSFRLEMSWKDSWIIWHWKKPFYCSSLVNDCTLWVYPYPIAISTSVNSDKLPSRTKAKEMKTRRSLKATQMRKEAAMQRLRMEKYQKMGMM